VRKFYWNVSVGDFAPSGFQTAFASSAVQLRNPGSGFNSSKIQSFDLDERQFSLVCDMRAPGYSDSMRSWLMTAVVKIGVYALAGISSLAIGPRCVFLVADAQEVNSEQLPMFGQPAVARSAEQKEADELFVKSTIAKYGSREAATSAALAQGWSLVRNGKGAAAMRHFNEAWLLSPEHPGAFWGFAALLSAQGKLVEAIEHLETARELLRDDGKQRAQLLADIGAVRSAYAAGLPRARELERAQHFSAANQRFAESLEIEPNHAPSWREWAISLYHQERYSEAWIKASRARELKAEAFPADFLNELSRKMAEQK
jgi:tetratricopeptide (TPR) repeat protein